MDQKETATQQSDGLKEAETPMVSDNIKSENDKSSFGIFGWISQAKEKVLRNSKLKNLGQ